MPGDRRGFKYKQWKTACFERDRAQKARCWRCRQPIDYTRRQANSADPDQVYDPVAYEPDHIKSWHGFPALRFVVSNGAPSHAKCNRRAGSTGEDAEETNWAMAEDWSDDEELVQPQQLDVRLPQGGPGDRRVPQRWLGDDRNQPQPTGGVVGPRRPGTGGSSGLFAGGPAFGPPQ